MKQILFAAAVGLAAIAATPAHADLNVFACEPEWGALATEIGGDHVDVYNATVGGQDPHQVQARPSLISRARTANVAVCTGAELEVAWLPLIAQQSGNRRIVAGQPGLFEATSIQRAERQKQKAFAFCLYDPATGARTSLSRETLHCYRATRTWVSGCYHSGP